MKKPTCEFKCFSMNFPRKQNTIELHYVSMGKLCRKCFNALLQAASYQDPYRVEADDNLATPAKTACSFMMILRQH